MTRTKAINRVGAALLSGPFLVFLLATAPSAASEQDDHGHEDHHGHGEEEEHTSFEIADFERHGVSVAVASPGTVDVAFELPGEVRPDADRIAHLVPRFAGLVRDVRKSIGDQVRAGETLARIESDNLTTYDLVAAFPGVVIDKHIAPGETVTRNTEVFIVADLSTVWVEIHVYQKALSRVRIGQSVTITSDDGSLQADGIISYIAPVVDQATRTATARVVLDNRDGRWRPGLFIIATVAQPVEAGVRVRRRALHTIDDQTVVFVEDGDSFAARPVVTASVGREWAGIAGGLEPGERYADENSFLVKAELAKGSGGHDH